MFGFFKRFFPLIKELTDFQTFIHVRIFDYIDTSDNSRIWEEKQQRSKSIRFSRVKKILHIYLRDFFRKKPNWFDHWFISISCFVFDYIIIIISSHRFSNQHRFRHICMFRTPRKYLWRSSNSVADCFHPYGSIIIATIQPHR